jgi:hypothetical protein
VIGRNQAEHDTWRTEQNENVCQPYKKENEKKRLFVVSLTTVSCKVD